MNEGKGLRIGGYISGGVLIVFGIAAIALGVWGFNFTRDHIKREGSASGRSKTPGRGACSRPQPGTSRPLSSSEVVVIRLDALVCCLHGRPRMEHLWRRAVATSGNRSQMGRP
jgi:hypothetical protein